MKRFLTLVCVLGLLTMTAGFASAELLSFDQAVGSFITITGTGTGASINFTGTFDVTSSTHGFTSVGVATFNGPWTYLASGITPEGGGQQAPVSGTGIIDIPDGAGHTFVADLNLVKIETNSAGTGGQINDQLVVNMTFVSYGGSVLDLLALENGAELDMAYTIPGSGNSLTAMSGTGNFSEGGFTGEIVTPLPPSALLLGSGLLGLALLGFRRKETFQL